MINNLKLSESYFEEDIKSYCGQAGNDNLIISMYNSCIRITNYKPFQPDPNNPRIKRFRQLAYYTHIDEDKLTPIKAKIYALIEIKPQVQFKELKIILDTARANNLSLQLEEYNLKKSELPYLTMTLKNDIVEVRIDKDGLNASDHDMNGESLYLDCCMTDKKKLSRLFLGEFDFKETTNLRDIKDFLYKSYGNRYPFHSFCNLD